MINICICDDETQITDLLHEYLSRLETEEDSTALHFNITICYSEDELIQIFQNQFDLIFLDIEIGTSNGIQVAKQLRKNNCDAVLIFITQYLQYATEGYKVNAYRYLLKPVDYKTFAVEVKAAVIEASKRDKSITVEISRDQYADIKARDIVIVEIFSRNAIIHMNDRKIQTCETLKNIYEKLDQQVFVKVYKNCIVNLDKVLRYSPTTIYMSNHLEVPLSRHRLLEFKQKYIMYWGSKI